MGRPASSYIGERFGSLVITGTERVNNRTYATVSCDCGITKTTRLDGIQSGATISCGCDTKRRAKNLNKSHGQWKNPTYSSWEHMKTRCGNPKYGSYEHITYDPTWENFENFYHDMGSRPDNTSLDRIDTTKGYSKSNCRWASRSVQSKNQVKRTKHSATSIFKGVGYSSKDNSYYWSVTFNYKTLRRYANDEVTAAKYFNFCTKRVYNDKVELNHVDDLTITVSEADMLNTYIEKVFKDNF